MRLTLIGALVCVALAGCSSSDGTSSASRGAAASRGGATSSPSSTTSAAASSQGGATADASPSSAASAVPRFAHVVVVIEENHADSQIVGDANAPYLNALGRTGVVLTRSFGVAHPSEPNYLALFSGSTQGLTDDSCPHSYSGDNLGHQLRSEGHGFTAYSESLPSTGFAGCSAGPYARKHAPWTDFPDLPASVSKPMTAFPTDYAALPTVSFVVPDLDHDMHDGTVAQADAWLRTHLGDYVSWARTHNSLLVVTWDEDDNTSSNHIPGLLAGAHLKSGSYGGRVDHYTLLRTIEAAYGLAPLGTAVHRKPITDIWTP
jgi:phosphatidylinositol-3-phosphatase